MDELIPNIWYATHKRANSMWKIFVIDDIGSLVISEGNITFQGKKYMITINKPFSTKLESQQVPWIVIFFLNLLFITLYLITHQFLELPNTILFLITIIIANILGIMSTKKQQWIAVEGKDESNRENIGYFTDKTSMEWWGNIGVTILFSKINGH